MDRHEQSPQRTTRTKRKPGSTIVVDGVTLRIGAVVNRQVEVIVKSHGKLAIFEPVARTRKTRRSRNVKRKTVDESEKP